MVKRQWPANILDLPLETACWTKVSSAHVGQADAASGILCGWHGACRPRPSWVHCLLPPRPEPITRPAPQPDWLRRKRGRRRRTGGEEQEGQEGRTGGGQEKGEEEEQEGRTALDRPRHTVLQFAGPSGKRRLSWASTETERATQELRPPKKMAPSVLGKLCFKSRFHRSRQPP
ncbi:unnamed protein product [Prorocentrum cordatum]|uniref:Uncharacterized protein n=1 Tax=Prorocentrum cordatum TaxID=2364126 RepID=A0ABN9RP42_9DINO|nr:unnamed protein product [Polarella glacialis]